MRKRFFITSCDILIRLFLIDISISLKGLKNIRKRNYSFQSAGCLSGLSFVPIIKQQNGTERHSDLSLNISEYTQSVGFIYYKTDWLPFRIVSKVSDFIIGEARYSNQF
ncbi:MAG: hypothetical protein Q8M67_04505 [Bacteroidota bacterium]|nr:hypothetical protein [Bacteroidota bacterium]